jgi:predicted nucleic acid-binding protein
MIDPASGPFLFDTSAESWLNRHQPAAVGNWFRHYLALHPVYISAVTVLERSRGYAALWLSAPEGQRDAFEAARNAYLTHLGQVFALDSATAIVAAEIMALIPHPPTPPRRSHGLTESRQERLSRWRLDAMIAATALVARMPLVHNNAADFEAIRSAIERSPARFPGLGPLELLRCTALV